MKKIMTILLVIGLAVMILSTVAICFSRYLSEDMSEQAKTVLPDGVLSFILLSGLTLVLSSMAYFINKPVDYSNLLKSILESEQESVCYFKCLGN